MGGEYLRTDTIPYMGGECLRTDHVPYMGGECLRTDPVPYMGEGFFMRQQLPSLVGEGQGWGD